MFLFISFLLSTNILFLWGLLISNKRSQTDEEKFMEDNLQMQYLKEFSVKKKKF